MKRSIKLLVFLFICFLVTSSNINFSNQIIIETNANQNYQQTKLRQSSVRYLKNLAIFIKFSDSDIKEIHHIDDEQSVLNADKIYNSDDLFEMDSVKGIIKVPSIKKYFERESYGNLSMTTEFFPKENNKVIAYTDTNPIGYYLKYNEQNKIGYKDKTESLKRETELLNKVIAHVSNNIHLSGITANDLDTDNDGKIDALSFIVEGQKNLPSAIAWGDLLWSHKSDNLGITNTILGKNASSYNLLYATDYTESAGLFSLNRGTYGTIIHEFGHTLGYKDLYRFGQPSSNPVGFYDIMGNAIGSNPQSFLTYYTSEYSVNTNWHSPLPVIKNSTNDITLYKPNFINPNEQRAIKIQIDENSDEYFVVEYHDKINTYESYSADRSGIIIYRVNEKNKYTGNTDGSEQGKLDHVYVFRPNETALGDGFGDLSKATLNLDRNVYGKDLDLNNKNFDNQTIFYSDGTNSGIKINVTGETNNSVTFNVTFPKMDGSGTKDDPYLINNPNTFLYLMSISTKNKYYKLTSDLDFKDIKNYPLINFEGNLDGNNKTIRNLATNGSGLFNNIGHFQNPTIIENLNMENLNIYSNSKNYLGGFANVAENITLKNIHLKNGTVNNEGNSLNDLVSTGGFLGNVNNTTIVENCSTNLNVTATKNVGGFIGLNMNATINNSFSSGKVNGQSKVGGFIGLQAISDNIYYIPNNVYYNSYENKNLSGAGGYANFLHNLNVLNEADLSKGIISVSLPDKLTLSINSKIDLPLITNPKTNLNYNINIKDSNKLIFNNNKLEALNLGSTDILVSIPIGTGTMELNSSVTIKENSGPITEEDVLNYLGLTKKENYVIGFALETNVKDIKNTILNFKGITLKSFRNAKNEEINEGVVATGMQFTLYFNNTEYNYTIVIKGDVNGDGYIYATDYVKIRNHIMDKSKLNGPYLIAADMNNDGYVYAVDYVKIRNYIMNKGK